MVELRGCQMGRQLKLATRTDHAVNVTANGAATIPALAALMVP
jgi:hypothetical protein